MARTWQEHAKPSMLLQCYCHALAMFSPCYCHAIAMSVRGMLLPCYCHALGVGVEDQTQEHGKSMPKKGKIKAGTWQ
jgi:hypothetical protein